jgi:hypothetical protein
MKNPFLGLKAAALGMTGKVAVSAAVLLVSAASITGLATTAVFGSGNQPVGGSFSSGSVDLNATPATSAVTMSTMAPGDTAYGTVTVNNSGTLQNRYAATTAISGTGAAVLGPALVATVKVGVTTCSAAGFAATGTQVYTGALNALAIGNPAAGADTGDRTLNAAASETLCISVNLPLAASNTVQGQSITTTFTFAAEQVKNNP